MERAWQDILVLENRALRPICLNPAFTRVFGWAPEEILGRKIDFVPDENWPETEMWEMIP
jgi:PAS domain S-box-containing protein